MKQDQNSAANLGSSAVPKSKHTPLKELLLFLSIPVVVILVVFGVVVLPSQFAHPKYDFVYASCNTYNCSSTFSISSTGTVSEVPTTNDMYSGYVGPAGLYYFTATTNASRRISVADANKLRLDSSNVSPDGYLLARGNDSGGGFLFWDSPSNYDWYLKNGSKRKTVNLSDQNNYSSTVTFLGWVRQ